MGPDLPRLTLIERLLPILLADIDKNLLNTRLLRPARLNCDFTKLGINYAVLIRESAFGRRPIHTSEYVYIFNP